MTTELALPNLMDDMMVGISVGRMPHISTDNKEFQAVMGKESRPIGMYDEQARAMYLEFILVGMAKHPIRLHFPLAAKDPNNPNPAQVSTYDPKNKQPPICSSENGVGPSADARQPQSAFCANCWAREWGSALSQRGERIPACTTKKRLAVIVPAFGWDTPLQFDIPPAAFQNWAALTQMLRDGKINRPEAVMIRAYFIANEDGFLKFTLSPLGYNEQVFGPTAMPAIHRHMLSDETRVLLGGNDKPLDPARFVPGGAALAAPVSQPQVAYTPTGTPIQNYVEPASKLPGYAQPAQHQAPAPAAPSAPPAQHNAPPAGYSNQPAHQTNAPGAYGAAPPAVPAQTYGAPAGPAAQPTSYSQAGGYAGGPGALPAQGPQAGPVDGVQHVYGQPGAGVYGGSGGSPYGQPGYAQPGAGVSYGGNGGNAAPAQLTPPPAAEVEYIPPAQQQPGMHDGAQIEGEPAKAKRTRRTKAQIEADNAAAAAQAAQASGQPQPQPNPQAGYGMATGAPVTNSLRGQLDSALGVAIPQG